MLENIYNAIASTWEIIRGIGVFIAEIGASVSNLYEFVSNAVYNIEGLLTGLFAPGVIIVLVIFLVLAVIFRVMELLL